MKKDATDLFSKFLDGGGITRRGMMKSLVAAGAASALYGCSKSDGSDDGSLAYDVDPELTPPKVTEDVIGGMVPHNCGGSCLTRVHVRNGVIKRVSSDETPEKTFIAPRGTAAYGDFIANRNCPRCRATASWVYGTNRLMYPMIQTKKRGDLSGFKRVTWEEAAKYFKAKMDYVRDTWGPTAYMPNATGAWGSQDFDGRNQFLGMGKTSHVTSHRDTYSWPVFPFIANITGTRAGQPPNGDNWIHVLKCDEMVLWSVNFAENGMTEQAGWYLKQMRELGKKITVIESRYNQTAVSIADKFLPVVQGTDGALAMAIMHYMLTTGREKLYRLWGVNDPSDHAAFRQTVGKYIYGFFDTNSADDTAGTNDTYRTVANGVTNVNQQVDNTIFKAVYKVGPGMSLSAYIRGNVQDPCNLGTCAYPETVGYNTSAPDQFPDLLKNHPDSSKSDRLHGKRAPTYSQQPKTPAWAAKICGVSEEAIIELAESFLTKNVVPVMSGGVQRNSESENLCWSLYMLFYFAKCFGEAGRNFGRPAQRAAVSSGIASFGWSNAIDISRFRSQIPNSFVYDNSNNNANGYGTISASSTYAYLTSAKSATHADMSKRITNTALRSFGTNYGNHNPNTFALQNWMDAVESSNSSNMFDDPAGRRGKVKGSRWGNAQVMGIFAPIKVISAHFCAAELNQSCDTNHAVRVFTATDNSLVRGTDVAGVTGVKHNPYGYQIEFIWTHDCVMTPQARWSDLVLPGTSSFERFQIGNSSREDGNKASFTHKAVNPPGEAIPEIAMAGVIAKAYGEDVANEYFGSYKGDGRDIFEQAADFEYKAWAERFKNKPSGMTMKEWAKLGIYKNYTDAMEQPVPAVTDAAWLADPKANSKNSPSGRVEAFCISMMEYYESNHFVNIDGSVTLGNSNELVTANTDAADKNKGRLVYPIPMYIPIVEGIHADGNHPDPMGLYTDGYTNQLLCWHPMIRSHATFASVPMLNELKYWKRNAKGEPAYLNRNITNLNAGADHLKLTIQDTGAPAVWQDDVYEVAWINPKTKYADGSEIKEGDLVVAESLRGKIIVSAHISNRVRPNTIGIAQGSWYDPIDHPVHGNIDRGGNVNTLYSTRGSRINQATTMSCDCLVKLVKYVPVV